VSGTALAAGAWTVGRYPKMEIGTPSINLPLMNQVLALNTTRFLDVNVIIGQDSRCRSTN
jgi:hypothetical protein